MRNLYILTETRKALDDYNKGEIDSDRTVELIRAAALQTFAQLSPHAICPHWKIFNKGGSGEFGTCQCSGKLS
jgi:hypothetical protein